MYTAVIALFKPQLNQFSGTNNNLPYLHSESCGYMYLYCFKVCHNHVHVCITFVSSTSQYNALLKLYLYLSSSCVHLQWLALILVAGGDGCSNLFESTQPCMHLNTKPLSPELKIIHDIAVLLNNTIQGNLQ